MSMEMLEDICDRIRSHPNVNIRYSSYKIRDSNKQGQLEWKGPLKSMQNMVKGLHKVFKTFVKEILQDLPPFGESGSEVSNFILEPRNFAEATKLSDYVNKPWLKATQKEIKNLINNHNFLVQYPEKGESVTP